MSKEDEKDFYSFTMYGCVEEDNSEFARFFCSLTNFVDNLYGGNEKNIKKIIINIRSDGGDGSDCDAVINLIKRIQKKKVEVVTVANSGAYSAGFYIFITGDQRIAYRNTTFLPHHPTATESYATEQDKENIKEQYERTYRHLKKLLKKHTSADSDTIKVWWNGDKYLTATQGKKYGFVDKII